MITIEQLALVTGGTTLPIDIFGAPTVCDGIENAAFTAAVQGQLPVSRALSSVAKVCRIVRRRGR